MLRCGIFILICLVGLFSCEGTHPEMQGKKLVLCDSLTMKHVHQSCETIYIEPTDSQYALIFNPFLGSSLPANPYPAVYKGQSLPEFYANFLTKVFGVVAVKKIPCIQLTDTDGKHHVYFVFENNQLKSIDYQKSRP